MYEPSHDIVYKVCDAAAWDGARTVGEYRGSADDLRDGYIHLSTRAQLTGTLARHFSDSEGRARDGLVLVMLPVKALGAQLKWEPARDGSLFPHLYGPLATRHAIRVASLTVGADGRHLLPGDMG